MWLISAWLLKQILLKSNWRLHGERLSPGGQQFSPGKWAEKSEKKNVSKTEFQPGLKSELRHAQ